MSRRALMYCTLLLLMMPAGLQARPIEGLVFHDANGNGRHDPDETAIAQVVVSDGKTVVQTDKDGRYALEVDDSVAVPLVFISIPSGYMTDRFFAHIRARAQRADFALRSVESPKEFYFIHLTDIHLGARDSGADRLKGIREDMAKLLKPAFVINSGDMASQVVNLKDAQLVHSSFKHYLRNAATLPAPVFNVMGNHDYARKLEPTLKEAKTGGYRMHLGPEYYSFNYGPVHFIVLDSEVGMGSPGDPATAAQLEWIKKDLALVRKGTPLILTYHHPVIGFSRPSKAVSQLLGACRGHPILGIFNGHRHVNSVLYDKLRGFPVIVTAGGGSLHRTAKGPHRICFTDGKILRTLYRPGENGLDVDATREGADRWYLAPLKGSFGIIYKSTDKPASVTFQLGKQKPRALKKVFDGLWTEWAGRLDTTIVRDGYIPLRFNSALAQGKEDAKQLTVLIDNGRSPAASAGATLVVKAAAGVVATVMVNGKPAGQIQHSDQSQKLTWQMPKDRLLHINCIKIKIRRRRSGPPPIQDVYLLCQGRKLIDQRYKCPTSRRGYLVWYIVLDSPSHGSVPVPQGASTAPAN